MSGSLRVSKVCPSESAVVGLRRFVTSLSRLQGSHEALFGLRVGELFNEGFSEQLVISPLCEQAAGPGSCELQNWMSFEVNIVYLCP